MKEFSKDIVRIVEPSQELFDKVEKYKEMVQKILPNAKITLAGSLAVPMCGKDEFDLLVEVDDVKKSQELIRDNSDGIFGIGPIVHGVGYCRSKKRYGTICELHLLQKSNPHLKKLLLLVEKLKSNPVLRKKFEEFKRSLDGSTVEEYTKKKGEFLKDNNLV